MAAKQLRKLPCKLSELCLDVTLNCGQSFRWKKNIRGEWMGVLSNKLWIICQTECALAYQVISPVLGDVKVENDTEDHSGDCVDLEFLKDYFQWEVDLGSLYKKWSRKDKNFSKISPDFLGVRMLRQDPVENLFSFICSSNNNIQRIKGMVEKLCETYGQQLLKHEGDYYYSFPTVETLSDPQVEPRLREMGFGYRAKFIQQSAAQIVENGGRDWLLNLRNVPYDEAKASLMSLPGIGPKVADCICLMSLNFSSAIPVDTHVFQIAKSTYMPHLAASKSVTEKIYKEISTYFQKLYGPYAGWAHSVLFSADLRHLKVKQTCSSSSSKRAASKTVSKSSKKSKK